MKKNHQFRILICMASGSIFGLSSCIVGSGVTDTFLVSESRQKKNFYYVPSAPNTPLHAKQYDANLTAMATSASNSSGAEFQASFMPGKHIGIIASYSFAKTGISDETKYSRVELGSGFVTQLSKNWHFETYAGLGSGKILNRHYTGRSTINLTHFFIQPAMVISNTDRKIQFGFVSKFSGVNFNVSDTSFNNAREPFSTSQVKSLYAQPFHIIWEPGIVFRAGWKNFQFHTGYSFSADVTNPDLYRTKGIVSIGLSLRMNTHEKK